MIYVGCAAIFVFCKQFVLYPSIRFEVTLIWVLATDTGSFGHTGLICRDTCFC